MFGGSDTKEKPSNAVSQMLVLVLRQRQQLTTLDNLFEIQFIQCYLCRCYKSCYFSVELNFFIEHPRSVCGSAFFRAVIWALILRCLNVKNTKYPSFKQTSLNRRRRRCRNNRQGWRSSEQTGLWSVQCFLSCWGTSRFLLVQLAWLSSAFEGFQNLDQKRRPQTSFPPLHSTLHLVWHGRFSRLTLVGRRVHSCCSFSGSKMVRYLNLLKVVLLGDLYYLPSLGMPAGMTCLQLGWWWASV